MRKSLFSYYPFIVILSIIGFFAVGFSVTEKNIFGLEKSAETTEKESFVLTSEEQEYIRLLSGEELDFFYSYDVMSYSSSELGRIGMLNPIYALLDDWGLKYNIKKVDSKIVNTQLDALGEFDIYGMQTINETRRQNLYMTDSMYETGLSIVTRSDEPLVTLLNLSDKRVGLINGSDIYASLNSYLYPNGQVVTYDSTLEAIEALQNREVFCVLTEAPSQAEIFKTPQIKYEFINNTVPVSYGVMCRSERLKPLIDILNRYLETPHGGELREKIKSSYAETMLQIVREYYGADVAYVRQNYEAINVYDNGMLFPLSFVSNGEYHGFLSDINSIFENISGVKLKIGGAETYEQGFISAMELMLSGKCQMAAGIYFNDSIISNSEFVYSPTVWTDTIRMFTADRNLTVDEYGYRNLRVGTTTNAKPYFNWSNIQTEPIIFGSRTDMLNSLKARRIDAALFSEMVYEYEYNINKNSSVRRLGNAYTPVTLHYLYAAENKEINRLMNAAINLNQMIHPQSVSEWRGETIDYKNQYAMMRTEQESMRIRTAYVSVALLFLFVGLCIFSFHQNLRYRHFDNQIIKLLNTQQTFDLMWGNIKKNTIVSKSGFTLQKKYGLLSRQANPNKLAAGSAFFDEYRDMMKKMQEENLDFILTPSVEISQIDGREVHFDRYVHYLNANEFMVCTVDTTEKIARESELVNMANIDYLSKLRTRRSIDESILELWERMQTTGERAFIVMFDIDNFKAVNDNYGHDAGDEILKMCSRIIETSECCGNNAARWGGEEFLVLLKVDSLEKAMQIVSIIIKSIEAATISFYGKRINVTISAGIAELDARVPHDKSITRSDNALYEAKRNGKNQYKIWGSPD